MRSIRRLNTHTFISRSFIADQIYFDLKCWFGPLKPNAVERKTSSLLTSDCLQTFQVVTTLSLNVFEGTASSSSSLKCVSISEYSIYSESSRDKPDYVFLNIAFKKTNYTKCPHYPKVSWDNELLLVLINPTGTDSINRVIFVSTTKVQGLTCSTSPKLSFDMYVNPFDNNSWVCIVTVGVVLCLFLRIHLYFSGIQAKSFSMLLVYISSLIEEPMNLPSALNRITWLRCIIVLWLLESTVIVCLYSSMLISELNEPLKGSRVEHLSQVFCDPPNKTYIRVEDAFEMLLSPIMIMLNKPVSHKGFARDEVVQFLYKKRRGQMNQTLLIYLFLRGLKTPIVSLCFQSKEKQISKLFTTDLNTR